MPRNQLPKPGDFPFPILTNDKESRYLTWVRNNSSYLNLSGVINVLQALAIYVRGVLGNLLIISPAIIAGGIFLGFAHFALYENPYRITKWMTAIATISAVGYFAMNSSNSGRSIQSPIGGYLFLALITCAIIESSPFIIEYFRKSGFLNVFGFKETSSIAVSVATGSGVLLRFLPEKGPVRRGIILAVLALLGFGLVWLVLLFIANYVCYGLPPHGYSILIPVIAILICGFCGCIYICNSPVLTLLARTISLVVILTGLAFLVVFRSDVFTIQIVDTAEFSGRHIGTITRPLRRLVDGANLVPKKNKLVRSTEERSTEERSTEESRRKPGTTTGKTERFKRRY